MIGSIIIHVPHASRYIPADARAKMLMSDERLAMEILKLTDAYTDEVIPPSLAHVVAAPVSRLVVDVERFRDDALEDMAPKGMGAVYTHTHDGMPFRDLDPGDRESMLARYYDPHHHALETLVRQLLAQHGQVLIIDMHSFPSSPLPYENPQAYRPEICLGTDAFHTPRDLFDRCQDYLTGHGVSVAENTPFSGALVPSAFYRQSSLVRSLMIEIRRDLIMDEQTGEKIEGSIEVFSLLRQLVMAEGLRLGCH